MKKKQKKKVKMHISLDFAYNSQDFAQTQDNFARLHDRETVTFRNSVISDFNPYSTNKMTQQKYLTQIRDEKIQST